MTLPWLAFIESNTSGTGRGFVRSAKENGYRPILLTADASRYRYMDEEELLTLQIDTCDQRALLEACRGLKQKHLVGILSSSEYYVATAATLAWRLGLPGPRPSVVRACRNKVAMRKRLQAASVAVPLFRVAQSVKRAIAEAEDIGFPVVVKPTNETGSVGVKMCENIREVATHAGDLLRQRYNDRGLPSPHRVLIEKLVLGPEYSVETFGETIIGITEKHLGCMPRFVEVGHDFPAVLSYERAIAVRQTVMRARTALGLDWGPSHFELRVSPDGPSIIEVNPRLAGGCIPELVKLATGIDLIQQTIFLATGHRIQLRESRRESASIRFLLAPKAGELVKVEGLASASATSGIVDVQMYRQVGEKIELHGDFRDRIGHVISQGANPANSRRSAETALSRVAVTTSPRVSALEA